MSELPTVKEEVERKTLDALEWIATSFNRGELSREAAHAAVTAVFQCVSGLIDVEIVQIATQLSRDTHPSPIAGTPPRRVVSASKDLHV